MFKVVMASNPEILRSLNPHFTVEAEYGDICVEGSLGTLAHHGSRSNNPAPCLAKNNVFGEYGSEKDDKDLIIGISHFDLDTLGGILAIIGDKRENEETNEFWNLAAFVDINGPHKISNSGASQNAIDILYAWWAYAKNYRYICKGDEVLELNWDELCGHFNFINDIFVKTLPQSQEWLENGKKFRENEEKLNKESFVEECGGVILRIAPSFTNHLYTTPDGKICNCVISYNTLSGAITISFADKCEFNAREIVQKFFGEKAGGHDSIAGSPRGKRMKMIELYSVWNYLSISLFQSDIEESLDRR